mgnify:FL=1
MYDQFGGQVVQSADTIIEKINKVMLRDIKSCQIDQIDQFEKNDRIKLIGNDIDTVYINEIKKLSLNNNVDKNINIIYTPLHGTGNKLVRRVLKESGYKNVLIVREQELPDPQFSTVKSPNPEEISSFKIAIKRAEESDGEIIIGTDPDCDRVGLVVKDHEGKYVPLNGNQTGALLLNYVLSSLNVQGRIPENGAAVKTIVTSEIGRDIAAKYKVKTFDTLTGFKYIAELMQKFEEKGDYSFLFGYEESYGYLTGTFVRDKDAVIASMLICEMAAYYKRNGKTLLDVLNDIYAEHGYYIDETVSLSFSGADAQDKMKFIMESFRENKINILAEKKISAVLDYKMGTALSLINGKTEKINYPKSDVLKFSMEDGSWFVLRPSGTEPKLKVYFSIKGKNKPEAVQVLETAKTEVLNLIDRLHINN